MPKIPIFQSDYSIGRSILTLELPPKEGEEDPEGPAAIFSIAKTAGLKEIHLLENNISSFPTAFKNAKKLGLSLRYGEVFYVSCTVGEEKYWAKVAIWALNDEGFAALRILHTKVHTEQDGEIMFDQLKTLDKNLGLCIPFYDSFLHKNNFTFASFLQEFGELKPTFFVEYNGLPQDLFLVDIVKDYAKKYSCPVVETQTIAYEKAEDVAAYMTCRLICDRGERGGGTLEKPNIDGFGSDQFSWERYIKENKL